MSKEDMIVNYLKKLYILHGSNIENRYFSYTDPRSKYATEDEGNPHYYDMVNIPVDRGISYDAKDFGYLNFNEDLSHDNGGRMYTYTEKFFKKISGEDNG